MHVKARVNIPIEDYFTFYTILIIYIYISKIVYNLFKYIKCMGKHHTDDYRQSAVNYYFSNNPSIHDKYDVFDCKRKILRCFKRYIMIGSVLNKPRPGSYKIMLNKNSINSHLST